MKENDRIAVQIDGVDVAEAYVESVEDGQAVLVIPATRMVVQVRQSLDLAATKDVEVDRVFAGLEEGVDFDSAAIDEANAVQPEVRTADPAPVYGRGVVRQADIGEGIHNVNLDSSAID